MKTENIINYKIQTKYKIKDKKVNAATSTASNSK